MDNKRITNRQCVETLQEEPKLEFIMIMFSWVYSS